LKRNESKRNPRHQNKQNIIKIFYVFFISLNSLYASRAISIIPYGSMGLKVFENRRTGITTNVAMAQLSRTGVGYAR
jgi:hypothetical protein